MEEDEGETNTYYLPGAFVNSMPSKLAQKKKKHLIKGFADRSYEMGSDLQILQSNEKAGNHQSVLIGKRASDTLNASIPTKRVRTASRQRVLSPSNAGAHGCLQAPSKTDASSGDTNSFQDDQNILQGGSHILNNTEVESVRNFDRQPQFDSSEASHKPKKKKKAKNLVYFSSEQLAGKIHPLFVPSITNFFLVSVSVSYNSGNHVRFRVQHMSIIGGLIPVSRMNR